MSCCEQIAMFANGDARAALQHAGTRGGGRGERRDRRRKPVEDVMQRKILLYDKSGEEHFNLISALHKSRAIERSRRGALLAGADAGGGRRPHVHRAPPGADGDRGYRDWPIPRALEQAIAAHAGGAFPGHSRGRSGAGAAGGLPGGGRKVGSRRIRAMGKRARTPCRTGPPNRSRCICVTPDRR